MNKKTEVFPDVKPIEDRAYQLAEAITSLFPAGQPILHALITPPIQKRLERWIGGVEARLSELERIGAISYEDIKENELFSALVLKIIRVAGTTAQEEKLNYLKSFAINLAKNPDYEEDELCILLGILEQSTPSHIKVLQFYATPEEFGDRIANMSSAIPQGQIQGKELAHVYGGKLDYWQNVFWSASGKHVITNSTIRVKCNATLERTITGKTTNLGLKLLDLINENR